MSGKTADDSAQAHGPKLTRRGLLKTVGAGATAAAAPAALDVEPVGRAEALPCGGVCVGAAVVGGAAAVGWALRDREVIGKDDPPEGLTAGALQNQVYNTAETRKSTNQSKIIDNRNILDGARHAAYADGKLAAVKALNNQKTKSEVTTAAEDAINDYATTIKTNLLRTWNESIREAKSLTNAIDSHSELTLWNIQDNIQAQREVSNFNWLTKTITMPDGTDFDVEYLHIESDDNNLGYWTDIYIDVIDHRIESGDDHDDTDHTYGGLRLDLDPGLVEWLGPEWEEIWTDIESEFTTVRDGIITWVDNVYGEVQSGELDTSDLLTPLELAELTSSEESTMNQALADLMALNIPVNLDREAKIRLTESDTTLYGSLAVTGETELSAGTTIDPTSDSKDYYLTYDTSEAHGTWSDYEEGVDGGTVTFTAEPHPSTIYGIETGAQETAEVPSSEFTDQGDGTWTVDISDQVETSITTITEVQFYSESDEINNTTVLLDETFEILKFEGADGTEYDSASYDKPAKPETDDNYITEEEWQQREQRYKDLIDKYEESQNSGGGGMSLGDFSPQQMVSGAVVLALTALGINTLSG